MIVRPASIKAPASLAAAVLSDDFDQGLMDPASEVDGDTIKITPQVMPLGSTSRWYCVRVDNMQGRQPTFELDLSNSVISLHQENRILCWSYDLLSDDWYDFDNRTLGETTTHSMDVPFQRGTVYVALYPAFPHAKTAKNVASWSKSEYVQPTASADSDFAVGYTSTYTNEVGDPIPSLPLYGLKITEGGGNKNIVVFASGNHARETPGRWSLYGAIEWLLGDSAEAQAFRQGFECYVYPDVNPDGIYGGYGRASAEEPNEDHNRLWNTSGVYDAIDIITSAIVADAGTDVDVAIDWHSYGGDWNNHQQTALVYNATGRSHSAFRTAMRSRETTWDWKDWYSTTGKPMQKWMIDTLDNGNMEVTFTAEHSPGLEFSARDHMLTGERYMLALHDLYQDGVFRFGP